MQILNEDIKSGQFRTVYLLYGEETFLKQSYKKKLRDAIVGQDTMNYNYFEGKGIDIKELISLADTMPFFSEKRLILVEDSGFFKSAADELVEYLPGMPETTCLIFVEEAVDKRGRLFKKLKELGYASEMKRQDSSQLAKWAGSILAQNGKKITSATMNQFLERTGSDMEHIRMELEKLISYTMGREVISLEDVKDITTIHVSNRIFDMVNAIVLGKTNQAMGLYEDLLALKEPPMRILFLIARQFNQLLLVQEMTEQGMDKGSIASRLKLPPFVVGKMIPQARAFTKEQLLSYVSGCVNMEEDVKTGRLSDGMAVELLLTRKYK